MQAEEVETFCQNVFARGIDLSFPQIRLWKGGGGVGGPSGNNAP